MNAIASLTAANASSDRARAALRRFYATTDEVEADRIHATALVERAAAEEAELDAWDEHCSQRLALAHEDGPSSRLAYEVSVWYDAHRAWWRAMTAWDQVPDMSGCGWES